MENFKVSDYLENYNQITKCGTCKTCLAQVNWSRERVAGHKRGKCTALTEEEKNLFRKRKSIDNVRAEGLEIIAAPEEVKPTKEQLDEAMITFFVRSGIAFRIADIPSFRNLISLLNHID